MNILVTCASKHRASEGIAEHVAETLREEGHTVAIIDPAEVHSLAPYDAVVVGSAVYVGRWLEPAKAFVTRHAEALRTRPVWLFSSGPTGDVEGPILNPIDVPRLIELSGAREHRIFAGRLSPGELGLAERAIVKVVKAPYGDFRDWAGISAWARSISSYLTVAPVA